MRRLKSIRHPPELIAEFYDRILPNDAGADECWLWQGWARGRDPYRFSYELAHGRIPKHCAIHYVCGCNVCVRPEHMLLIGTKKQVKRKR